jgi:DNA-binding MarR family transcriptional regulator
VDAVHEGGREARRGDRPKRLVAEGVVGALLAVLHTRLSEQSREPLGGLAGQLMAMVVLPYMGAAAAERERVRPAPPGAGSGRRGVPREDPLKDLDMRLTYRTVRVLLAIAQAPGASNRRVGDGAGIADQGQTSKLLQRLQHLGLVENAGRGNAGRGEPNAWRLTARGEQLQRTIHTRAGVVDGRGVAVGGSGVGEGGA